MGKCWILKFICFWSPFWYYDIILAWVADPIRNSGYLACRIGTLFFRVFSGERSTKWAWSARHVQQGPKEHGVSHASGSLRAYLGSPERRVRQLLFCLLRLPTRGLFLESPGNFSGPERCFVLVVFAFKIEVSIIFKNNTWTLSVNEAKLTGLWDRNCATIQQVVIFKFAFEPEKFPGLSRNGPQKFSFRLWRRL